MSKKSQNSKSNMNNNMNNNNNSNNALESNIHSQNDCGKTNCSCTKQNNLSANRLGE